MDDIDTYVKSTLIYQLHRLIFHIYNAEDNIIAPKSWAMTLYNKDKHWIIGRQQDSQEFLNFILDKFQTEIGRKVMVVPIISQQIDDGILKHNILRGLANKAWENYFKNEYSFLTNIFNGLFHSTITCGNCSHVSHTFEPFNIIQLSIPEDASSSSEFTIDQLLDKFTMVENLEDKLTCECCGQRTVNQKQIKIWKLPKILIIQMKRFKTDIYGMNREKLPNQIKYPITDFNLDSYISDVNKTVNNNYDLFGVNLHAGGASLERGHYYSFVKNKFNQKWRIFDDSDNPNVIRDIDDLQNKNAYVLFYIKH
jgi:ubiquitin C-terminal hydrolase